MTFIWESPTGGGGMYGGPKGTSIRPSFFFYSYQYLRSSLFCFLWCRSLFFWRRSFFFRASHFFFCAAYFFLRRSSFVAPLTFVFAHLSPFICLKARQLLHVCQHGRPTRSSRLRCRSWRR